MLKLTKTNDMNKYFAEQDSKDPSQKNNQNFPSLVTGNSVSKM